MNSLILNKILFFYKIKKELKFPHFFFLNQDRDMQIQINRFANKTIPKDLI
jgi:hypothetical protein